MNEKSTNITSARTRWQDHQAIRATWLQVGGNEIVQAWQGASRETLRRSFRQGMLHSQILLLS